MERRSSSGSSSVDPALKNYKLIRNIGHGAFGKVKLAKHRLTGLKVAIKILNRRKVSEQNMDEKVNRELMVGKLLVHPHVIRLYEVIETTSDIYVVMEYAERGELFDYIVEHRRLEEDEARKFFQQIISGVEYCHKNRVAHRDLKPENLLLDSNGNVKIADFGLCNIIRDGYFLKTSCGSPNYAAPEVLSGKPYIGPEVDVWSCGVILYVLLCGSLPFDHGSLPVLYSMIRRGVYTLPSHLTTGARDLIARMLAVEPLNRITIPEIRQHYWFQVNLPYYLAAALPEITHQMNKIDEEVLEQVVTLGYNRNFLDQSLQSGIQDDATVTYYLLLDNHRVANNLYNTELDNHMGLDSSSADSVDFSQSVASQHSTHSTEQQGIGFSPQSNSESRWGLGFQLGLHPHHIMVEVLNALRQLNVCWKKTGRYNIKCKWCRDGHVRSVSSSTLLSGLDSGDESSQDTLKFELQLYKTSSEKYLLDLHRLKGPQVLFIDLCSSFLARLQIF